MFLAQSQRSPWSPKVGGLGFCTTLPIVRAMSFCYALGVFWVSVFFFFFFLLFAKVTGFAHMEVLIIIPKQL